MAGPGFDTVILAGGRSARMGGADKPALPVGGQPMLVLVAAAAAAAGTRKLIVVGPRRGGDVGRALSAVAAGVPDGLRWLRESPPGSGPVAALRRGISGVGSPWLALLAADLPFLTGAWVTALLERAQSAGRAGAVLVDDGSRAQWLAGCWDAARLRDGLAAYRGDSLAGVLGSLQPVLLPAGAAGADAAAVSAAPPWLDCDSPAELAVARAAASGNGQADQDERAIEGGQA